MMEQQPQRFQSPETASILIADEERLSREALGAVLHQRGHDVYYAGNGLSMRAILRQARPQLVIFSLRLLGTHDVTMLRGIREYIPACTIIILSPDSNIDDRIASEVLELGIHDVLDKSTSLDRLLLAIDVGDVLTASAETQESESVGCLARASYEHSPRLVEVVSGAAA